MRVFDYNSAFAQLVDESIDPDTGEIINPDFSEQLAALEMAKEDQIEQMALAYKNAKADVEQLSGVIKAFEAKKASRERMMNYCREWLDLNVEDKFKKPPFVSIYHSWAKKADITDKSAIPEEYFKVTRTVKRDDIKKAIQAGKEVPGARVVESRFIVIK